MLPVLWARICFLFRTPKHIITVLPCPRIKLNFLEAQLNIVINEKDRFFAGR